MEENIIIKRRFNGPPDSGNGGYVCGLVARHIPGTAEVTLRKPPPLDKQVAIRRNSDGRIQFFDGETLIAEGKSTTLELQPPQPPSLEEARAAVNRYTGFDFHIFPTCFVCGPQRPESDGFHIFPGRAAGYKQVAAPWIPKAELEEDGQVATEYIWAALDCPGAFAALDNIKTPIVLGRLTAQLLNPIYVDRPYIVTGWNISQDGRKYYTGTAVFTGDGALCAKAQATWITLKI
jgi:hypothetical protein